VSWNNRENLSEEGTGETVDLTAGSERLRQAARKPFIASGNALPRGKKEDPRRPKVKTFQTQKAIMGETKGEKGRKRGNAGGTLRKRVPTCPWRKGGAPLRSEGRRPEKS